MDDPRSVLAAAYVSAIGALLFNAQPVLVGALSFAHGFTEAELGFVMSSGLLAAFCVVVAAFFWVPRVSVRAAVRLGAGAVLAGTAGLGVSPGFVGVVVGFVLIGAGMAAVYAPALTCLGATRDPARSFGIAISAQVLVASATLLAVPALLFPGAGMLPVAALLGAAALPAFAAVRYLPARAGGDRRAEATRSRTADPSTSPLAALGLVAMAVYFVGLNGTWVFLERIGADAGIPPASVAAALAGSVFCGALGALAASWLGGRVAITAALAVCALLFAAFVGMMISQPGLIGFVVALVLFNVAWNFSLPYQMSSIAMADHSGRILVLIPAAQTIGGALGPAISGTMLMGAGIVGVYVQLAVCIAGAFLIYAAVARLAGPARPLA